MLIINDGGGCGGVDGDDGGVYRNMEVFTASTTSTNLVQQSQALAIVDVNVPPVVPEQEQLIVGRPCCM